MLSPKGLLGLAIILVVAVTPAAAEEKGKSDNFNFEFGLLFAPNTLSLLFAGHIQDQWGIVTIADTSFEVEEYDLGGETTVCADGELSGSTGPGTCSYHGGVSGSQPAEYSRVSFSVGPTYQLTERLKIYGTVGLVFYTQYITVGETRNEGDASGNAEIGVSYQVIDPVNLIGHYAVEPSAFRIGASIDL